MSQSRGVPKIGAYGLGGNQTSCVTAWRGWALGPGEVGVSNREQRTIALLESRTAGLSRATTSGMVRAATTMQQLRSRDVRRRALPGRGRPRSSPGEPGSRGYPGTRYAALTAHAGSTIEQVATGPKPRGPLSTLFSPRVSKLTVVLADALALVAALGLSLQLSGATGGVASAEQQQVTLLTALWSVPVWIFALVQVRAYQTRFITTRSQEFRRVAIAGALGSASLLVISDLWRRIDIQRDFVVFAFVLGVASLTVEREVVRQTFGALRRRGHRLRAVAIVGDNAEGDELRRMFDSSPELGYSFAGFITVQPGRRFARPGEVLGQIDDAVEVLTRRRVHSVMIAASAVDVAHTSSLIRRLLNAGINVEISPTLPDIAVERLSIRPLGRFPVMYLQAFHQSGWRLLAKRTFDFTAAACGLVTLALPLLVVCVLIRLDSKGSVFYRQTRVGRNGKLFDVIKFRTMVPNAHALRHELAAQNEADGPLFKIKHDPRVTRVGRVLRQTSVDELPQLWNVLRGEMSLVGPRPALPDEAVLWSEDLRDRLRVQPGITGMWQVSGRSDTSFEEYSRLDLYYVDNWSLVTDLSILTKTLPTVLLQRGAS